MESHQQQGEEMNMSMNTSTTNNNNNNNGGKMSVSSTSNSSYLCRQSSTRWTPTSEQIKLLKELYYINGVRSPSADQIQSICSRLRRYGKIEGKNVFYWFQNHKARERQKKRLTPTTSSCTTTTTANNPLLPTAANPHLHNNSPTTTTNNNNNNLIINNNGGLTWRQQDHHQDVTTLHAKHPYSINNPGVSCSSSSNGVVSNGGQFMGNFGYGAVTMENKFRDCSISGGGYVLNNGGANNVNQWNGANGGYVLNGGGTNYNPYAPAYSNFLDKISTIDEDPYIEQDHYGAESPQIETLSLFPLHNENHDHDYDHDHDHGHHHGHGFYGFKPPSDGYYTGGYRWSNGSGGNASLELSLNSYGYGCYSQNL